MGMMNLGEEKAMEIELFVKNGMIVNVLGGKAGLVKEVGTAKFRTLVR